MIETALKIEGQVGMNDKKEYSWRIVCSNIETSEVIKEIRAESLGLPPFLRVENARAALQSYVKVFTLGGELVASVSGSVQMDVFVENSGGRN